MVERAFNWVRLDTGFARNDKVLGLVGDSQWRAIALYCFGLGHAREQKVAGFISRGALGLIHGNPKSAGALEAEGLWIPEGGGWLIHDWDDYQETTTEIEARSKKARFAADVRWGKQVASNGHSPG